MHLPYLAPFVKFIEGYSYLPQIWPFIKLVEGSIFNSIPETPQAGIVECGTLGVLHLKELLKNNAQQFKEYTLLFSFYCSNKLEHFYFPSPQLLRYSQVSTYNTILAEMLTLNKNSVTIEKGSGKDKRYLAVTTLQKILTDSIADAKSHGNKEMAANNQKIIDDLPRFSKQWLKAYQEAQKKRASMQGTQNYYLLYRTKKMERIIQSDKNGDVEMKISLN
jgi:hypothetical protein